ncbi:surface-adhesin E family protein [Brevundimonas sp. VNH65]|uniref:surface-adhesin E family protein n=1 Tax=Brevundimonas sp. VNH65 TaxID=3400917 RepID=UPI003C108A47
MIALLFGLLLPGEVPRHAFVITGAGRFAQAADTASITRDGDISRMRVLQVADKDFRVGETAYWGGWSWWRFDCAANTTDRLDFASVREGGAEGPAMADNQPAYDAAPGGDAAELLAVACAASPPPATATTVVEAVRQGRTALDAAD